MSFKLVSILHLFLKMLMIWRYRRIPVFTIILSDVSLRSVEAAITSCASYGRLPGHCLKMGEDIRSRGSFPVAWTTATLCSSAYRKD